MKNGLLKKPDGVCILCRRPGFKKAGLQLRGWNPGYFHPLAKLHLYRFETRNRRTTVRICVNCVHAGLEGFPFLPEKAIAGFQGRGVRLKGETMPRKKVRKKALPAAYSHPAKGDHSEGHDGDFFPDTEDYFCLECQAWLEVR